MFRPAVVLLISAGTAVLYGLYLLKSQTVGLDTFQLSGTFLYLVLIVVPFVAFLLDRAEHLNKRLTIEPIIQSTWHVLASGRFARGTVRHLETLC